ncbi:hypothetical protein NBRC116599_06910 [Aquicoccus sp. SU-CL01552]
MIHTKYGKKIANAGGILPKPPDVACRDTRNNRAPALIRRTCQDRARCAVRPFKFAGSLLDPPDRLSSVRLVTTLACDERAGQPKAPGSCALPSYQLSRNHLTARCSERAG